MHKSHPNKISRICKLFYTRESAETVRGKNIVSPSWCEREQRCLCAGNCKGLVQGDLKGEPGEKAEETMTWAQSITSKVNCAGSGAGAAARGARHLITRKILHVLFSDATLSHKEYLI